MAKVERTRFLRLGLGLVSLAAVFLPPAQLAAAGASRSRVVNFPGDLISEVTSRTGVTVYFVDPGPDANGEDERPILLRYPNGRTEQIDTFGRNADVSWSPHGEWLVVTNAIGSNVADCLTVAPAPTGAHKQSLTSLISRGPFRNVARDMRQADHVYVRCGRWLSPTSVSVEVRGHGCNRAPCRRRLFDHALVFDFRSGRLSSPLPGQRTKTRRYGA